MHPTFLTVARQGNNSWKHYLKSIFAIFGVPMALGTVPIVLLGIYLGLPLSEAESVTAIIEGDPFRASNSKFQLTDNHRRLEKAGQMMAEI